MVKAQINNHFDAPPEYVRDWLLDYKDDDTGRYFDDPAPRKATKKGEAIHLLQEGAMGRVEAVIRRDGPHAWGGENKITKGGKLIMTGRLRETVAPDGKGGTRHTVDVELMPQTFMMKVMGPLIGPKVRKGIASGFAKIKTDMEADYKAGRPPSGPSK